MASIRDLKNLDGIQVLFVFHISFPPKCPPTICTESFDLLMLFIMNQLWLIDYFPLLCYLLSLSLSLSLTLLMSCFFHNTQHSTSLSSLYGRCKSETILESIIKIKKNTSSKHTHKTFPLLEIYQKTDQIELCHLLPYIRAFF